MNTGGFDCQSKLLLRLPRRTFTCVRVSPSSSLVQPYVFLSFIILSTPSPLTLFTLSLTSCSICRRYSSSLAWGANMHGGRMLDFDGSKSTEEVEDVEIGKGSYFPPWAGCRWRTGVGPEGRSALWMWDRASPPENSSPAPGERPEPAAPRPPASARDKQQPPVGRQHNRRYSCIFFIYHDSSSFLGYDFCRHR